MNKEKEAQAEQIRREIWRLEEQKDKKKWKVTVYTFIVIAIVIYFIWRDIGDFKKISDYLLGIPAAGMASFFYMYLNSLIFLPILHAGKVEDNSIEWYRRKLRELEKEQE